MRKILITNDDGINAPGLIKLAEVAKQFGEVWVVAPDGQRSAMSHSITLRHSFAAWKVDFPVTGVHAFACNGTPGDCVRIGVLNIVPGKPDNVFSGINAGYNVASDLQYSATAGAAFEAAFQGVHAIAFSEDITEDHSIVDEYLVDIISELINKPLEENHIWNVNFPGCSLDECKGIQRDVSVSSMMFYADYYEETQISDAQTSYMVVGVRNWQADAGSDLRAVLDNYIAIGIVNNLS